MQRTLAKITVFAIVFSLLATAGIALAAQQTMTSDEGSTDTQTGTSTFPDNFSFGLRSRDVGDITNRYTTHTNHWNPSSNGQTAITFDDADTNVGYTLQTFAPGAAVFQNGAFVTAEGESDTASGHFHAPANYPFDMKGCHWGSCSTGLPAPFPGDPNPLQAPTRPGAGGPFPIQLSKLSSLVTTWHIAHGGNSGAAAPAAVWDASYDIWFDMNRRGELPGAPMGLTQENTDGGGQNDGAEVMIWLNNRGYNNAPITPAGTRITTNVSIPGAPDKYDVWVNRSGDPNNAAAIKWNVISFVRVNANNSGSNPDATTMAPTDATHPDGVPLDIKPFLAFARDSTTMSGKCAPAGAAANDPFVDPQNSCLKDNWWLTSVQTGFEVWAGGQGLQTIAFSVIPRTTENVSTGRSDDGVRPFINWMYPWVVRGTAKCRDAVMTYDIAPDTTKSGTGTARMNQPMTKVQEYIGTTGENSTTTATPANPAIWSDHFSIVAPTFIAPDGTGSLHGDLIVTFHVASAAGKTCADTTVPPPVTLFIDPSGRVVNASGAAVQGARVTLQRSLNQGGPFTTVPDHNVGLNQPILGPSNLNNPDLTGPHGEYGWTTSSTVAFYRVVAHKDGCGPDVTSTVVVVPPEVKNLNIILPCPFSATGQASGPSETGGNSGGGGSNLPTQVTIYNDWGAGYCAYFVVTNNTSASVNWITTFNMPRAGTIYDKWNFNYTRSGNQLTAQGDAAWDTTLPPGQSLIPFNHGFCVNTP